jgi:hypothetical protein
MVPCTEYGYPIHRGHGKMTDDRPNIKVSKELHAYLESKKVGGESFDSVLKRLVRFEMK